MVGGDNSLNVFDLEKHQLQKFEFEDAVIGKKVMEND
eukprot:CAMPEP_0170507834 /NCGR_PEP_ID=MMETSP0208-20121228/60288_1 /TAXON_ID=197538 /ORGANISM="Strombidium inclinatum, Strain S3" /LENGTH=36 /DNA_ID= /DNA_START= /DNA_END= /DNA_ORIENTATION=